MKWRKRITIVVASLVILAAYGTAQGANLSKNIKAVYRNIAVVIDSVAKAPSQEPFIYNDHVYVPLRYISEALGCRVDWDDAGNRVLITSVPKADPAREQAKYQEGYNAGLVQGQTAGQKTSFDKGHKEGYDEGYKKGHDEGYKEGLKEGSRGGSKGSRSDYSDGEDDGYYEGKRDGARAAKSANKDKNKSLSWKDALEEYMDIRYRYYEDDIVDYYEDDYDLNFRRYPDYTDGFVDGYMDGFADGFERDYEY